MPIKKKDLEVIQDPNFWPEGIIVRKFFCKQNTDGAAIPSSRSEWIYHQKLQSPLVPTTSMDKNVVKSSCNLVLNCVVHTPISTVLAHQLRQKILTRKWLLVGHTVEVVICSIKSTFEAAA